eukprot:m.221135 g.221135  ORF g.221135 m.221135 type:complete len:778 (-) comp18718_c1_seq1:225-2558(-)
MGSRVEIADAPTFLRAIRESFSGSEPCAASSGSDGSDDRFVTGLVAVDSPLRRHVLQTEEQLTTGHKLTKKIAESAKCLLQPVTQPFTVHADSLSTFGQLLQSTQAGPSATAVLNYSMMARELVALRTAANDRVGKLQNAMQALAAKGEASAASDAKGALDKAIKAFESARAKGSRGGSSNSVVSANGSASSSTEASPTKHSGPPSSVKRTLELRACEYVKATLQLRAKREMQLVQQVTDLYTAQIEFFKQGLEALQLLMPDLDVLLADIEQGKASIQESLLEASRLQELIVARMQLDDEQSPPRRQSGLRSKMRPKSVAGLPPPHSAEAVKAKPATSATPPPSKARAARPSKLPASLGLSPKPRAADRQGDKEDMSGGGSLAAEKTPPAKQVRSATVGAASRPRVFDKKATEKKATEQKTTILSLPSLDLDLPPQNDTQAPRLRHLSLSRPKSQKKRLPTRARLKTVSGATSGASSTDPVGVKILGGVCDTESSTDPTTPPSTSPVQPPVAARAPPSQAGSLEAEGAPQSKTAPPVMPTARTAPSTGASPSPQPRPRLRTYAGKPTPSTPPVQTPRPKKPPPPSPAAKGTTNIKPAPAAARPQLPTTTSSPAAPSPTRREPPTPLQRQASTDSIGSPAARPAPRQRAMTVDARPLASAGGSAPPMPVPRARPRPVSTATEVEVLLDCKSNDVWSESDPADEALQQAFGFELAELDGRLTIARVVEHSVAAAAGLQPKDRVLKLAGQDMVGSSLEYASVLLMVSQPRQAGVCVWLAA